MPLLDRDGVYPDIKSCVICYQSPTRIYHEVTWYSGYSWSSVPVGSQIGALSNNALHSAFEDSSCISKMMSFALFHLNILNFLFFNKKY